MNKAVDDTVDRWTELNRRSDGAGSAATLRDAALVTAIERIATVVLHRDIWP